MPHWSSPRLAGSARLMIRVAEEHGVSFERCIEGTELTRAELADPLTEIEGRQELQILRNILQALGPDVPFALRAGLRYHITTHGVWGLAIVSSANIRSAIDFLLRYFDLSYSFNRLQIDVGPTLMTAVYDATDNPDDLQPALVERDLGALLTLQREGLGHVLPVHSLELRSPPPPYASLFKPMFGVTPRFNSSVNRLTSETKYLDASGPLADEVGRRIGEQQCVAMLDRRQSEAGITGEVRRRILRSPGHIPSMNELAAALGMSTRTLRNRLGREASSYRRLVEDVKMTLAEEFLSSNVTVDAIADRLGYADASSFGNAFKRWKGVSPRGYRPAGR